MLDDDFKKIEGFLKAGGNSELHVFQQFEEIVNNFILEKFISGDKEKFFTLNKLLNECYAAFDDQNDNVIKDFAIAVIVIKNLITIIQNDQEDIILNEKDKKAYIDLIQLLITSIKKVADSHLSFFTVYSEYIDDINSLLDTNN